MIINTINTRDLGINTFFTNIFYTNIFKANTFDISIYGKRSIFAMNNYSTSISNTNILNITNFNRNTIINIFSIFIIKET